MTTSLSTSNSLPNGAADVGHWPDGLPDPAVLARLANEFLAALPGQSVEAIGVPGQRGGVTAPLDVASLRDIPAVLAGASGASLQPVPTPSAGESLYYFLESGRVTSPQVIPALNLTPPGLEPALGFTVPSAATAAEPGGRPLGAAPGVAGLHRPAAVDTAGLPPSAPHEVSRASFYFIDEVASSAATPAAPQKETAKPRAEATSGTASRHPAIDAEAIRRDFPILEERVHGKRLVWLDNGATTQRPQAVIDRLSYFYRRENSNIHRAAHELAARATDAYEAARGKVARFLHASTPDEIVFVRGTTEAINLVAQSWGRRNIGKDDEIVISWLEHHANIVPWQQLCAESGARLRVAPVDDDGQILLDEYEKLFNSRTKLAAFSQVSNALGTITPVREMVEIAHRHGARALVDGAQAVSHLRVDVQALDCDWYVFSGHKVFGPTGIGAVYGKLDLL
ncbi:MAG: cysteine desulfurase, partial [Proteobacteria bacterium]|nr:cysteine desulfurase [Pseudomonadota bacterium]